MTSHLEFEGATLDAALEQAAARLGRQKNELDYELLREVRGILGVVTREIAIRVTVPAAPSSGNEFRPPRARDEERRPVVPQPSREERPRAVAAVQMDEPSDEEGEYDDDLSEDDVPEEEVRPDETAPDVGVMASDLIGRLHLDLQSSMEEEDERIVINLVGADREQLVSRRGEVLEAIQYLLNRMARKKLGTRKRVLVESEGFRSSRDEEVRAMAMEAAERVLQDGRPVKLPPLNPYERRIVHVTLSRRAGVDTESEGNGFVKRVTVWAARRDRRGGDAPARNHGARGRDDSGGRGGGRGRGRGRGRDER